jgi:MerR family transcriptional regulator, copper efflux regulator
MERQMNIGEAAQRCGLPTKTIRYYESVGLLRPARRTNGFRRYREREVEILCFLARARSVGFSVDECRKLLALFWGRRQPAALVRDVTAEYLRLVESKRTELTKIEVALKGLIAEEPGDPSRPKDTKAENIV